MLAFACCLWAPQLDCDWPQIIQYMHTYIHTCTYLLEVFGSLNLLLCHIVSLRP